MDGYAGGPPASGRAAPTLVALSGYSGGEYRARAREAGFDAYLVKPVELDELRAVLGSLAREREGTAFRLESARGQTPARNSSVPAS